jgi:hypothetical protein
MRITGVRVKTVGANALSERYYVAVLRNGGPDSLVHWPVRVAAGADSVTVLQYVSSGLAAVTAN